MRNSKEGYHLKKVLVLSDNFDIAKHIFFITNNLKLSEYSFSFYCTESMSNKLENFGMQLLGELDDRKIDWILSNYYLVISAHCKTIFPARLVNSICCINIHPGYNPINRGWFPHVFSIINNNKAGCTIHLMSEKIDHGPIIYKKEVSIESWDTSTEVYNKVIAAEKCLLTKYFYKLISKDFDIEPSNRIGNFNKRSDYDSLCYLDLNKKGSLEEHINHIRALSHDDYWNTYFIDKSGNKVFIKITMKLED